MRDLLEGSPATDDPCRVPIGPGTWDFGVSEWGGPAALGGTGFVGWVMPRGRYEPVEVAPVTIEPGVGWLH